MYSTYFANKNAAKYSDKTPSKTDQSQAGDTDVNVIVRKYAVTGKAPGMPGNPMYGDFSDIPGDLRSMLEEGRKIRRYKNQLPEKLKTMEIKDLLRLTPTEIQNILKEEEKPTEPHA